MEEAKKNSDLNKDYAKISKIKGIKLIKNKKMNF